MCRIHLALKAYHELLNCVCMMDQSKDNAVRNSAQVIKGAYNSSYYLLILLEPAYINFGDLYLQAAWIRFVQLLLHSIRTLQKIMRMFNFTCTFMLS